MIYVFTHKVTNRIKFAFNLVFKEVLQLDYKIIDSRTDFEEIQDGYKVAYTLNPIDNAMFIRSKSLLFEHGITDQEISIVPFDRTKAFFAVSGNSMFPFDIFAASFYLASRYEEYLPHKKDVYNRFDANQSLAYAEEFLHQPVINIWCKKLGELLQEVFPNLIIPKRNYEFITTIDVDNAYAYKEKGFVRTIMGFGKSFANLDLKEVFVRAKTLVGVEKDPYDTFDYQKTIIERDKLKFIYFFLLGDYGVNDKNIPVSNTNFRSLIKSISDHSKIGIHPSFASNESFHQLEKEINRLNVVINREIHRSRQHFLKLELPDTYRNLIELDITDDYTMGYASNYGFRAGICTPYCFYDLDLEVETKLRIHPFAIMEGTLKYYMQIKPENALVHFQRLIDEVKYVDGTFISLWHNDTINDIGIWKGWRAVFEGMIDYGKA